MFCRLIIYERNIHMLLRKYAQQHYRSHNGVNYLMGNLIILKLNYIIRERVIPQLIETADRDKIRYSIINNTYLVVHKMGFPLYNYELSTPYSIASRSKDFIYGIRELVTDITGSEHRINRRILNCTSFYEPYLKRFPFESELYLCKTLTADFKDFIEFEFGTGTEITYLNDPTRKRKYKRSQRIALKIIVKHLKRLDSHYGLDSKFCSLRNVISLTKTLRDTTS